MEKLNKKWYSALLVLKQSKLSIKSDKEISYE